MKKIQKITKIYFQYHTSNKDKEILTDKNWQQFKFLKVKCSRNNPVTYIKYMKLDDSFIIPDLVWMIVEITFNWRFLVWLNLLTWEKIL